MSDKEKLSDKKDPFEILADLNVSPEARRAAARAVNKILDKSY